ncbi:beta-lactamase family protein [Flavobacterium sp. MXW15]|uniref:Beta-lactamase family protein n=1 Tax=Xanthomonas chitinilytica TaxID=2989819 RepID=A0ABT3JY20_9XANT|nr:serine hydrolase domain-containing protein [Xanthomonas sp. H13-6]MCW4454388.1 beta-lactamase family protein [Flavobacterium sp. MXW15]MCW4473350.1 beta-lactamase family protein [Xanthomonas sp. H13-6]
MAFLLAFVAAAPLPVSAASHPDFDPLAGFVQRTKTITGHPSGTAIAVVKDGRIVYEGYFGYSDIAARTPVTGETAFYIASATKPFFALNVLMKEEAGQLDTRTTLRQMFPGTGFAGIEAESVTLRDLLVHSSGVDNPSLVWATAFSGVHDARSRLALVAASHPDAEAARGTFKYTNVGYNIASIWLDRQLAMPWQQQLDNAIFQPLGMRRTSARVSEAEAAGWPLAKPYSFVSEQPRQPLYLAKSDDTMHAAGGLLSTAPDLARFLTAQLRTGEGLAIPETAIERSHEPQAALAARYLDFPRTGYAWGWYTGEYKGRTLLHHFGGFSGFHAHLSFMPEEGIALVVLNNEDFLGAQLTSLIADYVYGVLLEQPGIESTVSRRFDELQAKAGQARQAATRQRQAIRARAWNLSRPRADYAGRYSNALLGDLTVESNDGQEMTIRWGRLAAVASGDERRDHVRVEFSPSSGQLLAFAMEDAGVEAVVFEQMVFRKIR